MRILIITPVIPYPLDEGGKVSQFVFLEFLQSLLEIHLVLVINSEIENSYANQLAEALPHILIHKVQTDYEKKHIPKPVYNIPVYKKVYWKFYDLFFKSKTEQATKIIIPPKQTDDFDRPIEFLGTQNKSVINSINRLINNVEPDIVQIEHNAFLNFIEFIDHPRTVFVEHEIQFGRLLSLSKKSWTAFEKYKLELNRTIEIALLSKFGMVLCFSEDDKKLLQNNGVNTKVEVSPFPIQDSAFFHPTISQKQIEKIIFVGSSAHYPNQDAIEWYIDHIAKNIYEEIGLKFYIIGKCKTDLIEKYNDLEYVIFEGYVDDLVTACTNSIMVVPLKIGSGIRTKIIYGMAQELPIISTAVGCEGLGATDNENIMIANTAEEIKKKVVYLYRHQDIAEKIGFNAFNFIQENFSQKGLASRRVDLYNQLLEKK